MKNSEEYVKEQHKQFRDDIMQFSGVEFLPVSDTKIHIAFAVKDAQKDAIEATVTRLKEYINSMPDWCMISDDEYADIQKELIDKIK